MYSGMVTLTFGGSDWLSYDVYMGATPTTFIWVLPTRRLYECYPHDVYMGYYPHDDSMGALALRRFYGVLPP